MGVSSQQWAVRQNNIMHLSTYYPSRCMFFIRACVITAMAYSVLICGPAHAIDHFFKAGNVSIRYVEQGKGEPLLLLHGNGGKIESFDNTALLTALTAKYRVIRYDARGHGQSDKPHNAEAYGAEQALDTVRLMDHLGIRRAHVVGYSMGGIMASQLLTLQPGRIASASLIAGAGRLSMTDAEELEWKQEGDERERECVSRTQILRLAPRDEPPPTEQEIQARSKACFSNPDNDAKALAAFARSKKYQLIDLRKLAEVTVPTLAIVGDQDAQLKPNRQLKEIRPSVQLVVVPGATHNGPRGILLRSETLDALLPFLATNQQVTQ